MSPTDRLSIVLSAAELARFAESRAQDLDWPMRQLREGKSLPPAEVLEQLDGYRQLLKRIGAHEILIATLIARDIPTLPPPSLLARLWLRLTRRVFAPRSP